MSVTVHNYQILATFLFTNLLTLSLLSKTINSTISEALNFDFGLFFALTKWINSSESKFRGSESFKIEFFETLCLRKLIFKNPTGFEF